MKHTKGNWDYSIENVTNRTAKDGMYCKISSSETEIAKTTMIQNIPISKIELANAKLIAAAPDMLKVLQQFIHSVEHEGVIEGRVVDAVRNAEEAIKKATE